MRAFLLVMISLATLAVSAVSAAAQKNFPSAEVFGGYQFTHLEPSLDANGWNAAITGNVNRWFGVTADFSGAYKNGGHIYTYMFGPSFTSRVERLSAFGHVLAGGAASGESNAFSIAMGGGIDVSAGRHLAVRLIQADWLVFRSGGVTDKRNARVSTGVVFRF
jgi:hypothetical protein